MGSGTEDTQQLLAVERKKSMPDYFRIASILKHEGNGEHSGKGDAMFFYYLFSCVFRNRYSCRFQGTPVRRHGKKKRKEAWRNMVWVRMERKQGQLKLAR